MVLGWWDKIGRSGGFLVRNRGSSGTPARIPRANNWVTTVARRSDTADSDRSWAILDAVSEPPV